MDKPVVGSGEYRNSRFREHFFSSIAVGEAGATRYGLRPNNDNGRDGRRFFGRSWRALLEEPVQPEFDRGTE